MRMDTPKQRILCVDDHQDICELVAHALQDYDVTCAGSKAIGLKLATTTKFDLIILDYYLPDGTGLELCYLIRAFDQETPILFCTTSSDLSQIQAVIAGAQGLIKKGLSFIESLEKIIPRLLAKIC